MTRREIVKAMMSQEEAYLSELGDEIAVWKPFSSSTIRVSINRRTVELSFEEVEALRHVLNRVATS